MSATEQDTHQQDGDALGHEAAHWLLALEDDPDNSALHATIAAWRARSATHEQAWQETCATYGLMAHLPATTEAQWPPRSATVHVLPTRQAWRGMGWRVAASVAVLAFGSLTWQSWPMLTADYLNSGHQPNVVTLEDGSRLHLAPDSAVQVDYQPHQRTITLQRGEAFVEVSPNPQRPLSVSSGPLQVTAIGTAFAVRAQDSFSAAQVSVRSGTVQISCHGRQDDALQASAGSLIDADCQQSPRAFPTRQQPPEQVAAWTHGQLVVNDRPVREVIAQLEPYLPGTLLLNADFAPTQRVTGVYTLDAPQEALQAVVSVHGGEVKGLAPWLTVIEDKK